MRRLLVAAGVAAAALGFGGGAGTAQADVCLANLLCGVSGFTGTVNVCGGGATCSGFVNVCPFIPPHNCTGNIDVCFGPWAIACGPDVQWVCDLLPTR